MTTLLVGLGVVAGVVLLFRLVEWVQTPQGIGALLGLGVVLAVVWPAGAREQAAARFAAAWCAHPGTCAPAAAAPLAAPAGGYTPATWARALLGVLGAPATDANVRVIVAWERAEGGHWSNGARYNPLNTTQREPGSWAMNSVGVQAYTSWAQGLDATRATLTNGRYGGVLAALRAGSCAACVAAAVGASPWGTGWFSA